MPRDTDLAVYSTLVPHDRGLTGGRNDFEFPPEVHIGIMGDYALFNSLYNQVSDGSGFHTPLGRQAAELIAIICADMKERLLNVHDGLDHLESLDKEEDGDLSFLFSDKIKELYGDI